LGNILEKLADIGYRIGHAAFFYYDQDKKEFVHFGLSNNPTENSAIPINEIKDRLILKIRKIIETASQQNEDNKMAGNFEISKDKNLLKSGTRNKERKIDFIIEKVSEWRKLYTGVQQPDGKIQKLSLEEAAKQVGIQKKTLDDYLLQLRAGRRYGFDFNSNKHEKVGVLRAFVKKAKEEAKAAGNYKKEEEGIF